LREFIDHRVDYVEIWVCSANHWAVLRVVPTGSMYLAARRFNRADNHPSRGKFTRFAAIAPPPPAALKQTCVE
jgi:hypothetical protein